MSDSRHWSVIERVVGDPVSRLLIPGLVGAGEEWLVDCAGGGVLLYAFEGGDLVLGPSCCFFGQSLSTCLFCSCFLHILNEMLKSVYFLLRVTSSSLKALVLVTTYLLFLFLCLYSQPCAFWLSKIFNLHIKKYTFSNLNNRYVCQYDSHASANIFLYDWSKVQWTQNWTSLNRCFFRF